MGQARSALRVGYGLAALAVFAVEVCIALFVDDSVVRPHVGDALAVILVYLALRAATRLSVGAATAAALLVATAIELAQGLHLLAVLGLADNRLVRVVLGGVFDVRDFAAYAAGALVVLVAELAREKRYRR